MGHGLSRAQIAVYAALGVVLVLLGVRAVRGSEATGSDPGPVHLSSAPVGQGVTDASSSDVVVHVSGAVREPGVYRLPAGSRVIDAVERAGGPTGSALPDAINLAARLGDGQQVVVPDRAASSGAAATTADQGPISLGSATTADLEQIEGIGPVTAADIIAFRDEHGGVSSVEELDQVPGIGPTTLESLVNRLQP